MATMLSRWVPAVLSSIVACTSDTAALDPSICEGPNPALSGPGCKPAIDGECSGDLIEGFVCVDRAWVCPEGTLRIDQCQRFAPNPFDLHPTDSGLPDAARDDNNYGDGTCTTINPSLGPDRVYCLSATNNICCGDIGYAMICTQGRWACDLGQIPYTQCMGNCFDTDAGTAD